MIAAVVILDVLAMVSVCYFFFRSKNDYAVIFFVLSMMCMHYSTAYIVVKGTEARLGVQLFEDGDKILPPDRVYFQVTCLTGMYEQPDAKSRRILELRKRTVLYAYGTRDGWVRVRTAEEITGQKATNALHAIGWVPMCDVKHYPKQKLNILISLVQQIYGLTDFVLDCSQIAIGVSVVMLFRRKRRTIIAITATVFFVLSCLHVIYLLRRFFAIHAVHDVEFLNIGLFYVIGMGLAIGISSLVTERVVKWIKHHRISEENQQEKPGGVRKGRTKIEESPTPSVCRDYLTRFSNGKYAHKVQEIEKSQIKQTTVQPIEISDEIYVPNAQFQGVAEYIKDQIKKNTDAKGIFHGFKKKGLDCLLEELITITKKFPDFIEAYQTIAAIHIVEYRFDKAERNIEIAKKLTSSDDKEHSKVNEYLEGGYYLSKHYNQISIVAQLVKSYPKKAAKHWEKAQKLDPQNTYKPKNEKIEKLRKRALLCQRLSVFSVPLEPWHIFIIGAIKYGSKLEGSKLPTDLDKLIVYLFKK